MGWALEINTQVRHKINILLQLGYLKVLEQSHNDVINVSSVIRFEKKLDKCLGKRKPHVSTIRLYYNYQMCINLHEVVSKRCGQESAVRSRSAGAEPQRKSNLVHFSLKI